MNKYADYLREDQRLALLRLLSEMPSYRSNSSVLVSVMRTWGHEMSRDQVKTELTWLGEQGLLKIEDNLQAVLVVALTERGADVAAGRVTQPGVKRPGPG